MVRWRIPVPNVYVDYLHRPVRQGRDDRQRRILSVTASWSLRRLREAANGRPGWALHPRAKRAMLCSRLNGRRMTSAEAYAQTERMKLGPPPRAEVAAMLFREREKLAREYATLPRQDLFWGRMLADQLKNLDEQLNQLPPPSPSPDF